VDEIVEDMLLAEEEEASKLHPYGWGSKLGTPKKSRSNSMVI